MRTLGRPQVVEREPRDGRFGLRPRFAFRFRFRRWHLLLSSTPGGGPGVSIRRHLYEMTHLLEHATQRRVIGVHDFIMVMIETQGDQRALHSIGVAAAGALLFDLLVSIYIGRMLAIEPRLYIAY